MTAGLPRVVMDPKWLKGEDKIKYLKNVNSKNNIDHSGIDHQNHHLVTNILTKCMSQA